MRKALKLLVAGSVLGATALGAVAPAEAHDEAGIAIAAGILGLGVGAAIASDHPHYRPVAYYDAPPPRPYYAPAYGVRYDGGYGYDDGRYGAWQQRLAWDRDQRERHWAQERRRQWERRQWEHDRERAYGYGY